MARINLNKKRAKIILDTIENTVITNENIGRNFVISLKSATELGYFSIDGFLERIINDNK